MQNKSNNSPMKMVITDADGLADNSEQALIVLHISRDEIKASNFGSALERLHTMADTRENVLLYRESLVFVVAGYDDDSREIFEIPEVRQFFTELVDEWPHWFWFLCRDGGLINLLMSLICKIKVSRNNGMIGYKFINDNLEFSRKVSGLLERGEALYRSFNIPNAEVSTSLKSALEELGFGQE